jgi:hypothetical protein
MGRRTAAAKSSAALAGLDIQRIINDDFASRPEAALQLEVAERTLERWLKQGDGPPVTWLRKKQFFERGALAEFKRKRQERKAKAVRQ